MTLAATEHFGPNLAALMESQPSVAALVEAAPVPDGVTPVTGRDGINTFKVPDESGLPVWFGGSSMPSISAAEMFAGGGGGGNVALPGVLTGNEPLVLLGRLFPHEMLFVLEESPLAIKLAMHLYDYAGLIASGRLVFLLTADLIESMTTFFEAHPGCLLPARLLAVAQRSASQTADLQRRLEHAGAFGAAEQNRAVDSYVQVLRERAVGRLPDRPRVAVLGTDARPASLEHAERIGRALEQLHWAHEVCVPSAPDKCHLAARLAAVDRVCADFVLIINAAGGSMRSQLPPDMPVASWYLPGASVEPQAGRELHEGQLVFASSKALLDAVVRCGVAKDVVRICPVAADDAMYRPLHDQPRLPTDNDTPRGLKHAAHQHAAHQHAAHPRRSEPSRSDDRGCENPFSHTQVSVLMDLPDLGPEAAGVTQASHISLWHAMEEAVLQNVDRYRGELAEELLDIAQRVSGTTLQDAQVRSQFVGLLRARLAPAVIAGCAARALVERGYRVGLWGANWPAIALRAAAGARIPSRTDPRRGPDPIAGARIPSRTDPRLGPIPVGSELNELLDATDIVLLPQSHELAVQTALDALAVGVRVILLSDAESFSKQYPGLEELLPHLCFYRTRRELVGTVSRLLLAEEEWIERAPAVRRLIQSNHSVATRLTGIVERLRTIRTATV